MIRSAVAFVIASTMLLGSAQARTLILCRASGQGDVTIALQDRQFKGRWLSCISGPFVVEMTPCAPSGGYGLSGSTGIAALGDVVMRWQDYADHFGGVASFDVSPDRLVFSGGFMAGRGSGFRNEWTFSASRLTGEAKLTPEGKLPIPYQCQAGRQRF